MICYLITSSTVLAQKQANIWHFGFNHALDFSSGTPTQIPGSQIQTFEGSASYCDSLGNFLFYTNGGGREPAFSGQDAGTIWDRNNAIMYDMQGTQGGGFSSRQSAVIFEAPGQSSVYYVFTMDEIEYAIGASPATNAAQPLGRGLRYFTVDMSLNGALGGVVLADQPVYEPSAEGLCAIRHSNKRDYWILINQDSTGIGVYSVTSSGVNFVTNYTAIGGGPGIIKASPDASKVRVGSYLLDFNNSNGQFSNPINLNSTAEFFEFSPNSRFVYELISNSGSVTLARYDLQSAAIPASVTTIGTISTAQGVVGGQMQLGPDGKIYFLEVNFPSNLVSIHRINCPNAFSPTLQLNLFTYNDYFVGLPNFAAWLFEDDDSTYVSLGPDSVNLCDVGGTYTLNALNPGASYLWSTGATTQIITVNTPGVYTVTVTGPCGSGTDQVVITNCSSGPCVTFLPTGAPQQWIVPSGVDTVRVQMWGAAGGGGPDSSNNNGGGGGYTELIVPVVAGDVFQIVVGSGGQAAIGHTGGTGGYGGGGDGGTGNRVESIFGVPSDVGGAGGGGGLTLIRVLGSINTIIGIAGGGGGGAFNRTGGGGGGLDAEFTASNNPFNIHGFGGTQTSGGAPSSNTICGHPVSGTAGGGQQGGTGATDLGGSAERTGGGGGGAGYWGGGGGGSHDGCFGVGSAGGGGSGFVCATCPGLTGFTLTAGFAGVPANAADPLLNSFPGTATGNINQNGGGGLVQICPYTACIPSTDSLTATACGNYISPGGTLLTQSGVYSDTLTSITGCDSIVVLDLTINALQIGDTITAASCNSYVAPWGTTYTQSGIYSDTLTTVNGCDSIASIDLTITGAIFGPPVNAFSCDSYTAPWGEIYNQSGTYIDTLLTVGGCDSLIVLNLTIGNSGAGPLVTVTACSSYVAPNGAVLTIGGLYVITFPNAVGCDSIVSILLTIENTIISPPIPVTACSSYTASWGTTYTQSGTYSDTLITVNGCDSIVTVDLIVTGAVVGPPISASSCDTYTAPWGEVYNQSGTYIDTLLTTGGCDSLIVLNLTIGSSVVAAPIAVTACDSYAASWGTIYTQSGTYTDTLTTSIGCDSVISLELSIVNSVSTPPVTATSCGIFTAPWGTTYALSGSYSDTLTTTNGCDSIVTVNLTVYDSPSVQISTSGASTAITAGDSLQLTASGGTNYQWSPGTGLSCTACPSPVAVPAETITYSVVASDSNGCSATASITITVDTRCNELFVPTIFSPNGIGPSENEKWCVFSNCIATLSMGVYDRWGQLIFETTDPEQCWDGKKDGKEVPTGVYAFRLFVVQTDGKTIERSGTVTLTR